MFKNQSVERKYSPIVGSDKMNRKKILSCAIIPGKVLKPESIKEKTIMEIVMPALK